MNTDRIFTAELMIGNIVVFHGSLPSGVVDVDVFGSRYFVELKIFSVYLVTAVTRRVISYHSEVVAVVLSKDGVEGILNPKSFIIFKTGRYDTHW